MINETITKTETKRILASKPPRRGPPPNPVMQMLVKKAKVARSTACNYLKGRYKSYRMDKLMDKHGYDLPIYRGETK